MRDKTAKTTAKHLASILDEIGKKFGNPEITKIITDDGSEFKGDVSTLLKKRGIGIQRALGGNPQQNGLVERANGKVKQLIGKTITVKGGSWHSHLNSAVGVYNRQYIRATKYAPEDAVRLDKLGQEQVKNNVSVAYTLSDEKKKRFGIFEKKFEVGDRVRVKLNKGKLDKSSVPNWSSETYKVVDVIRKQGTRAERYKVNKKGTEDKNYTRNDLLKVVGDIEKQEVKKPVGTRAKVKAVTESSRPETRSTRSATTTKPKPAPPIPVKKKVTPKGKFKKGDKVRVKMLLNPSISRLTQGMSLYLTLSLI